ncbi:MAG TPA: hypothetical protein VK784_11550, partial [Pseudonocardiaceae bacterium]|nr:hypothetical protein [Pseudonocardiaceae bacterium]
MTWSFWASRFAPQRLDAGLGRERLLGGAEALADHVHVVVPEHVLLGGDDLREAVHALGLRDRRLDQQDVRAGGDRVRVLHVQRGLTGPGHVARVGWVIARDPADGRDDPQRRWAGYAPGLVEGSQVAGDRG